MSRYVLCALLCLAAAGSASAQVFKSVGADGKVTYSDYPTDKPNASVSIIKADIVQSVSAPVAEPAAANGGAPVPAAGAQVCVRRVDVLVGRNGNIIKTLGTGGPLSAFKTY